MILDSNLVIYAALPQYPGLRTLIAQASPVVSAVTMVEVLGYHKLDSIHKTYFQQFFGAAIVLPVTEHVLQKAIELRQARKMTLGDSLIAATAMVHGHELLTRNTKDFDHIQGLIVRDPLESGDPSG